MPIIVVYTKLDLAVDDWMLRFAPSHPELGEEDLTKLACSEAESTVRKRHEEINRFAGESLPYAVISSKQTKIYLISFLMLQ